MGTSHAPQHLAAAAKARGFKLCWLDASPDLVFISEDTPTDSAGKRDLEPIRRLCQETRAAYAGPVVLTSQVPPGFTRGLGLELYHQADTLRIKDAPYRAMYPEMLIVGCQDLGERLPSPYADYLARFQAPVLKMTLEEAEFAKVAINCFLAAQVETTNELSKAAAAIGARWDVVADVLRHDSRIGQKAYLQPGRWQDSSHLVRDRVTLNEIQQRGALVTHVAEYLDETAKIAAAIDATMMERMVEALAGLRDVGGRLFLAGLGGSAANCSHAASDFRKLAGIQAIALSENVAELTARANDEGFGGIYAEALETYGPTPNDVLFVFSVGGGAGGVSEPLVRAVMRAKQYGMLVVGVVGRDGGYTREHGDVVVLVPNLSPARVTPHAESFQVVLLHCLVSHPKLQRRATKW